MDRLRNLKRVALSERFLLGAGRKGSFTWGNTLRLKRAGPAERDFKS
jgi:hypothetical protein